MAGETIFTGAVWRYETHDGFTSALDPLDDLVLHLDFLSARDFTTELLRTRHGVGRAGALQRATKIRSHAQLAAHYIHQARSGQIEISFVSCYYAVLNLLKVCILSSPLHERLAANRLHGAAYDPTGPNSRTLPADEITLHRIGAIPLYLELLAGSSLSKKLRIRMGDVYPYISDISAEWDRAIRKKSKRVRLRCTVERDEDVLYARYWIDESDSRRISVHQLPALARFRGDPKGGKSYVATDPLPSSTDFASVLNHGIDRRFLYFPVGNLTTTALSLGSLPVPEEIPIVLAFYHMSSVARYNPELLDRLRTSRYWPAIAALRLHGMYKYLLLFWSFMRQANVTVER